MKSYMTLCFALISTMSLFAQKAVDIRFNLTKSNDQVSCFDIELRSIENTDILLAGQNYRIFYNPVKIDFVKDKLKSHNHLDVYSEARSLRSHYSKEISVAMMNLGVDALEYQKNKMTVLKPHQWQKTSNVCVSHAENTSYNLTWARARETGDLATAFVSLSEWVSENKQKELIINEYYDYDFKPKTESAMFSSTISFYPNPVISEINLKINAFASLTHGTMVIIDAAGKQIHEQKIDQKQDLYNVDMRQEPSGNYFIEILDEAGENIFQTTFVKTSL